MHIYKSRKIASGNNPRFTFPLPRIKVPLWRLLFALQTSCILGKVQEITSVGIKSQRKSRASSNRIPTNLRILTLHKSSLLSLMEDDLDPRIDALAFHGAIHHSADI